MTLDPPPPFRSRHHLLNALFPSVRVLSIIIYNGRLDRVSPAPRVSLAPRGFPALTARAASEVVLVLLVDEAPAAEDADLVLDGVDDVADNGEDDEEDDDDDGDDDVFLDHGCGWWAEEVRGGEEESSKVLIRWSEVNGSELAARGFCSRSRRGFGGDARMSVVDAVDGDQRWIESIGVVVAVCRSTGCNRAAIQDQLSFFSAVESPSRSERQSSTVDDAE